MRRLLPGDSPRPGAGQRWDLPEQGGIGLSSYIRFEESPTRTKTRFFKVLARKDGYMLGSIHWHPHWRQYCFFPSIDTVWSDGCLEEIQAFIRQLMAERRALNTTAQNSKPSQAEGTTGLQSEGL